MSQKTVMFALPMIFTLLAALGCGSSSGSGSGGGSTLGAIGDDCTTDTGCASGLCDNNNYCAAPVATLDGGTCSVDTDCPSGDHCDTTTGQCFSAAQDGKGGNNGCKTNADCAADETCDTTTGKCAG